MDTILITRNLPFPLPYHLNDSDWDKNNEDEQYPVLLSVRRRGLDDASLLKDQLHPVILASIIALDGSLNFYYHERDACIELLKRDETFRKLVYSALRTKKWWPLRKYPALKLQVPSKTFEEGPHEIKGATHELFLRFEQYRMSSNCPDDPEKSLSTFPKPLWLTVSFIRHAQARSNLDPQWCDEPDPLTGEGKRQLTELKKKWANVHIDAIYSSDVIRTRETAAAVVGSRLDVTVQECHDLIEQDHGSLVRKYTKEGDAASAYRARTGKPMYKKCYGDLVDRRFRPTDGESSEDVARRAQSRLLRTMFEHAVSLDEDPLEATPAFVPSTRGASVDDLPENVSHVVLVAHNIFLTELYESILCWDRFAHKETPTEYRTSEWSRHLICLDYPHDITPNAGSYRERWFGLRLKMWDLKAPRQNS